MNESNDGQSLSSTDYNNSDTFLTGSHENNEPSLMERTAATGTNTSSDEICTTTLVTNADHDDSMDKSNLLDKVSIPHFFSNMKKELSETMNIKSVNERRDTLKSISTKHMSRCWVTDSLRTETEIFFS